MNPQTPSSFQSFADYLGLNEEALRELEASAADRAMQADEAAMGALGSSYQQAQADMAAGGEGNLSQQSSYLDYVRARREAENAAALPATGMSPAELAARQAMREGAPMQRANFAGREAAMRESLGRDAAGFAASRRATDEYRKRQQAERDEQDRRFKEAEAAMGPAWADRQRYGRYSNAVQSSFARAQQRPVTRGAPRLRVISDEEYSTYGA